MSQTKGPLDGLLVVALEQAVAAPYATSRLADAGARVIKIERADGDFARGYDTVAHGQSSYFVWLNRGKESLVLDIKQDDDAALLERILSKTDVFVQNLAPGAAARAGFGSDDLRERYPSLITCDISGYGTGGAYAGMKGYDMLVQGESGLCSITGNEEAPARVGVSVCDIAAGMYAQSAILEALIKRGRTGKGEGLSVSLFDGMADWMAVPLLHHDYGGKAPKRVGLKHPSVAPYEAYKTADGGEILISIQNEREWQLFCNNILQQPDWATEGPYKNNVERCKNRDALIADIAKVFARYSRADMVEKLKESRIAFGAINTVADLSVHPAFRRLEVETPNGPVAVPAPPAIMAGGMADVGPVPAIGEHTAAIKKEFSDDG